MWLVIRKAARPTPPPGCAYRDRGELELFLDFDPVGPDILDQLAHHAAQRGSDSPGGLSYPNGARTEARPAWAAAHRR